MRAFWVPAAGAGTPSELRSANIYSQQLIPAVTCLLGQTVKPFPFGPSTLLQRQKKIPQPAGLLEPTHCLQLLDSFNAQVKDAKLGVIVEQEKSELAQLCFSDISHEFLLSQSSHSLLSFFPSYLLHLCETGDVNPAQTVLKTLLSFDTCTSTSDFKESLWGVSNCKAKGTPFQ